MSVMHKSMDYLNAQYESVYPLTQACASWFVAILLMGLAGVQSAPKSNLWWKMLLADTNIAVQEFGFVLTSFKLLSLVSVLQVFQQAFVHNECTKWLMQAMLSYCR